MNQHRSITPSPSPSFSSTLVLTLTLASVVTGCTPGGTDLGTSLVKAHPEAAGRVLDLQRAQESTVVADQVKTGGSFATRMRTNPAFDAAFENYLNRSAELAELAKEARERGDLEGAVAHLEEVVAMAPQGSDKKPRFLFVAPDLARLYIELDRPADAVKVLRSTEGNMVIDTFQPLLCLAYVKLNDFANAKKALAGPMFVTLNIEGDDPVIPKPRTMTEYEATAWAALAMEAYTTSSPIVEQELLFGRAYRLWPDQPIIELYWGITQAALNRYEEAEALLLSSRAKGSGEFARSIGVKLQRISSLADMERRKRNG